MGLRLTAGIRPEPDEWLRWRAPIERFVREGIARKTIMAFCDSPAGAYSLSNEVFQEF